MTSQRGQIQVIDRAMVLLRALSEGGPEVRLRDLTRSSGLSPSTTRRILSSLIENDLCEQNGDGSYRLGLALFELGTRVEASFDLRDRSRPGLERLAATTNLTAFLCVRRDLKAICIDRIDGNYAFSLALTLGGSLQLHVGGASRALLAWDSDEQVLSYLRDAPPFTALTPRTLVTPEQVLADVKESRERGWAISNEDVTPGVAAIGAPIFGHVQPERPLAAISVAGLTPHVLGERADEIAGLLTQTADTISRSLGYEVKRSPEPTGRPLSPEAA